MSLTGKYVSIEQVIEQVYMDHPFEQEIDWEKCLEWTGRAMRLMGVPSIMIKTVECIEIEDYKAELPNGILNIDMIRYKDSDSGHTMEMRYEGSPFIIKQYCKDNDSCTNLCKITSDITYRLNDNYIFTSFEEGCVEIAYDKFPIDERGYPLVPDDQGVIEGISWFIAHKIAYTLWMLDKLSEKKFQYIRQQKDWYIGKAISRARILSKDDMETWKNMTLRLIPKINAHRDQFRSIGNQERRYNDNQDQSQGSNPIT